MTPEAHAGRVPGREVMSAEWVPPKGDVKLTGTVTFVCAACGGRTTEPVLAPLDDEGRVIPGTKAYHPDCTPQEVTTDGS